MATPTAPRIAPTPAPVTRPAGASKPTPAVKSAPPRPSRLGAIKRGRLQEQLRYMWYGPPGVGKTSLIADMPAPLLLDVEGGTGEVVVARYPFRVDAQGNVVEGGHVPETYEDIVGALEDLIAHPGHGHETLGIDGFGKLESMLHTFVCKRDGKANIEAYGYGKGYKVVMVEWRRLLSLLDTIRHTGGGMQIAICGHSVARTFKNPEGEDFDRYQPMLHELAAGELVAWADVVGFIHFEGGGAKLVGDESQNKRARGWNTERRLIELARTAAWDAKPRLSLPAQIELGQANPFRPFAEAKASAREATVESLTADITTELERITGGDRDLEFMTSSGRPTTWTALLSLPNLDVTSLGRILAGLKATASVNTAPVQES